MSALTDSDGILVRGSQVLQGRLVLRRAARQAQTLGLSPTPLTQYDEDSRANLAIGGMAFEPNVVNAPVT